MPESVYIERERILKEVHEFLSEKYDKAIKAGRGRLIIANSGKNDRYTISIGTTFFRSSRTKKGQ